MPTDPPLAACTIAGLPISAWLLLIAAVGIGLALEIRFYLLHRPRGRSGDGGSRSVGRGDRG